MHSIPRPRREQIAAAILRDLRPLVEPGRVVELRALDAVTTGHRSPHVVSGYYDDLTALARDAAELDGRCRGIYVTLNPVAPALLARAANRIRSPGRDSTTGDSDVSHRTLLLVDLDPVRPGGISATEEEHGAALARAREVRDRLSAQGWPAPVLADSGNGAHLLYRVDLPADAESAVLIPQVLRALHLLHSDQAVAVDTSVGNPARIRRLYGTMTCKGDSIPERPHRRSCILEAPDGLDVVPRDLLEALAARVPHAPATSPSRRGTGQAIDLAAWLRGPVSITDRQGGQADRYAIRCPGGHEDGAWAMQFSSGAVAAGCHHSSCAGFGWRALREHHEPRPARAQEAHPGTPEARQAQEVTPRPRAPQEAPRGAITRRLSEVEPRPVSWLWPGRVPLGKITAIAGRPGLGKSMLATTLAAAVSRGRSVVPGETSCRSGGVILLAGEDGLEDTVAPRLLAAGADMTRIVAIDGVAGPRGERGLSLAEDLSELEAVIDRDLDGDCRLIIIDPPAQFLGRPGQIDSHRDSDVRAVLGPLAALAERRGLAVLLITHHRKSAGATADQAISGSLAFCAAARAIWHVVPDPEDRSLRLLVAGKCNLAAQAPGLRFGVDDAGGAPRIAWMGTVDAAADDYMLDQPRPARRLQSAADWLRVRLQVGPTIASVVKQEGRAAGYPERTLDRARVEIGATAYKDGMQGPWVWSLPPTHRRLGAFERKQRKNLVITEGATISPLGEIEDANNSEESPWLRKAPNILVGGLASSGGGPAGPSPVEIGSDPDLLEVWL
ncbi:MAG: AAA family ATPase [Burkholderiales bacterium]|nr:AAA family ATPase [Burkholderiales bacterium]